MALGVSLLRHGFSFEGCVFGVGVFWLGSVGFLVVRIFPVPKP